MSIITNPAVNGGATGGAVTIDGINYLPLPDGTYLPLQILAGTPHEPTVAGVVQQVVSLNHGSDVDHVEIMWTFNCTTGDPDTADTDLASARFSSPSTNAEVIKSGIIGATAGTTLAYSSSSFTKIHFALAGAGPYTVAASNTLTALEMVVMSFANSLDVNVVEIRVGTSTVGGGSNKRYRTITVTGYSA